MIIRPVSAQAMPVQRKQELAEQLIQDGVEIRYERKLGLIPLGTRAATPAQVVEKLGVQPLTIGLPGMLAVPLQSLEDAAVLQGHPGQAERPIHAESLKQLAKDGWRFFTDEGEVGLFGAYDGKVEARKDGRVAVLENQQSAAGLVEFYRRPPLEGRLENDGYRFFTADGQPSCALQGAWIGKAKPWLPVGKELQERLDRFEPVLARMGDEARARAAFNCLDRLQGAAPEDQAKQLLQEVKGSAALAASLLDTPAQLRALAGRSEEREVLEPLVERLAQLNEMGRVGLAVGKSVKNPVPIYRETLKNADQDACFALPADTPGLEVLLAQLQATRPSQVAQARAWMAHCKQDESKRRLAQQALTGASPLQAFQALKPGYYNDSEKDQVRFGQGVLPTLSGVAPQLALRMLAVAPGPSLVEAGLQYEKASKPQELAAMISAGVPREGVGTRLLDVILEELGRHPETQESARLARELSAGVKGDQGRRMLLQAMIAHPHAVAGGEAFLAASKSAWYDGIEKDRLAVGRYLLEHLPGKASSLGQRMLTNENVGDLVTAVLAHRDAATPQELAALALQAVPKDGAMEPLWDELAAHPETADQALLARQLRQLCRGGDARRAIARAVLEQPNPEMAKLGAAIHEGLRTCYYDGIEKDRTALGSWFLAQMARDPKTAKAAELGRQLLTQENHAQVLPAVYAHSTASTPEELAALSLAAVPGDGAMQNVWDELARHGQTSGQAALARELNAVAREPGSRKIIAEVVLAEPESAVGLTVLTRMQSTWYDGIEKDRLALGKHFLERLGKDPVAKLGLQMVAPLGPGRSADGILKAALRHAGQGVAALAPDAVPQDGEREAMKPLLDALGSDPRADRCRELDALVESGSSRALLWNAVLNGQNESDILTAFGKTWFEAIEKDRLAVGTHFMRELAARPETRAVGELALRMGPHEQVHKAAVAHARDPVKTFARAAIPDEVKSELLEPVWQELPEARLGAFLLDQLKTDRLKASTAKAVLDQTTIAGIAHQALSDKGWADGLVQDQALLASLLLGQDKGPVPDFIRATLPGLEKPPQGLLVGYYQAPPDAPLLLRGRAFLANVPEAQVSEVAQRFLKLPELTDERLLAPMVKQAAARLKGLPGDSARTQVLAELDRLAEQAGFAREVEQLLPDDSTTLVREDARKVTVGAVTVRRKGDGARTEKETTA